MAAAAGRVKLREAIDPLVLAVDVGSTASRGDVYDAAGRPVQGGREKVPHHFTTRDGGAMRVLVHSTPQEIPSGLWCYRVDGSRSLLGGAVNDVGRVVSWLQSMVRFLPGDDFNLILAAAPQASTPIVLPYFSGERSTGWAANARAVFAGVSAATTGALLSRGAMEGVAISYARIADQLRSVAGQPQLILASGRVTQDLPAWLQILADVLEATVIPVTIKRSTLRGTALIALDVMAPDVARTASATGKIRQPVADRAAPYRARKQDYQALCG